MQLILCLFLLTVAVCSANYLQEPEFPAPEPEFPGHIVLPPPPQVCAAEINKRQSTWVACEKNFAECVTDSQKRGLVLPPSQHYIKYLKPTIKRYKTKKVYLPKSFNAVTQWKEYAPYIDTVYDGSATTAAYAIAVVTTAADRMGICYKGKISPVFSAIDIISCCKECGDGTKGGFSVLAWQYGYKYGFHTGGYYNSTIGCRNYPFQSCRYHENLKQPICPECVWDTPKCVRQCDESVKFLYTDTVYRFKGKPYLVESDEKSIQYEIMTNGPVTATFNVYEDFMYYCSGIYRYSMGEKIGVHVVKIIGWGVDEKGVKYWEAINSWGTQWGDKGYLKFLRGKNHCGIESSIYAASPE